MNSGRSIVPSTLNFPLPSPPRAPYFYFSFALFLPPVLSLSIHFFSIPNLIRFRNKNVKCRHYSLAEEWKEGNQRAEKIIFFFFLRRSITSFEWIKKKFFFFFFRVWEESEDDRLSRRPSTLNNEDVSSEFRQQVTNRFS